MPYQPHRIPAAGDPKSRRNEKDRQRMKQAVAHQKVGAEQQPGRRDGEKAKDSEYPPVAYFQQVFGRKQQPQRRKRVDRIGKDKNESQARRDSVQQAEILRIAHRTVDIERNARDRVHIGTRFGKNERGGIEQMQSNPQREQNSGPYAELDALRLFLHKIDECPESLGFSGPNPSCHVFRFFN